jgi:hypothetical protein
MNILNRLPKDQLEPCKVNRPNDGVCFSDKNYAWAATCCVCNVWLVSTKLLDGAVIKQQMEVSHSSNAGVLLSMCFDVGDYYYIVPYTHEECRQLFELNPCAYIPL